MNELKPCPFCGGEVSIAITGDGMQSNWFVTRGHGKNACKCRVFMESEQYDKDSEESNIIKDDLAATWNCRADGWISVKERLPENDSAVMTYSERYGIDVGYYNNEVYQPIWKEVTHWKPLPQPPEATP